MFFQVICLFFLLKRRVGSLIVFFFFNIFKCFMGFCVCVLIVFSCLNILNGV